MMRIKILLLCVVCSACAESTDTIDPPMVTVSLRSVIADPCPAEALDAGVTNLVTGSTGSFRVAVEAKVPKVTSGDVRALVEVVASGTPTVAQNTINLVWDADSSMFVGTTTLAVPSASFVVVRATVLGRQAEEAATFVNTRLSVGVTAERKVDVINVIDTTATVTCTRDGDAGVPAIGVPVTFSAAPGLVTTSSASITDSSGVARARFVPLEAMPSEVLVEASAGGQSDQCVLSEAHPDSCATMDD